MITGLNHVTIGVKKLEESFAFYRDILGFKPLMRASKIAYFLVGDLWFCLDEDPSARSGPLPEYTHIAFSISKVDFQPMATRLERAHVQRWKENESEGESIYFLDPDGHKLEIHVGDWRSRLNSVYRTPWEEGIEFFE